MKAFITGGTGFIGTHVSAFLLDRGHQVTAVGSSTRHKTIHHSNFKYISADTTQEGTWQEALQEADFVVNLAGRTIMKRWTESYKKQVYDSRISTTRHVVAALPANKSTVLCSASAVGYYGDRNDEILAEDAAPGKGFLAEVGLDWESEALEAEKKGVRVALLRFGVVLGKGGGAMEKMVSAFRMYVGGPMGDGTQWFPWIHIDDVAAAIFFIVEHPELKGPFNFTAPQPVKNRDMAKTLGQVLRVPAFMPAPKLMLRLALGEVGATLLESQRAVPHKLLESGYSFIYPDLETAIQQIVQ
jgi:uncharacterized protein (TIGR01777 family)